MVPRVTFAVVALLAVLPGGGAGCNHSLFSTQLDGMLATYDRDWAPGTPVVVEVALVVRHATIYESSNTAKLLADFHMSWKDKRLVWNASEGECYSTPVAVERLWRPDVSALGASTARDVGDAVLRAVLAADGRITWIARLDLETPVTLDLAAWPRDRHRIVFDFGSRTQFVDEMKLTLRDFEEDPDIDTVFESGSWEMLSQESSESLRSRASSHSSVATYVVTLRRRAESHAMAAGAVLAGTALLLVAAALLPPAARAPLCAAASFTAALWLASAVPRVGNSSSTPHVLRALGALCACGGAAAAGAALALRLARCSLPAPAALRRLRAHTPALRKLTSLEGVQGVQDGEGSGACGVWVATAQLLDALCVLALLLVVLLAVLLVAVLV